MELAAKDADANFIKQTLQIALLRLMGMDVEALCNAAYGKRSTECANCRNGSRGQTLETRGGTLGLKIPKLRRGSHFPEFLEPRRTADKALTAVIQEAYIRGIALTSRGTIFWSRSSSLLDLLAKALPYSIDERADESRSGSTPAAAA